jgi:hypothetical protein
MAAAVGLSLGSIIGCAAAGVAEFFRRRAFVPVTQAARPVLFSTCAGVQGVVVIIIFWFIAGMLLDIFCHVFTIRTVAVR